MATITDLDQIRDETLLVEIRHAAAGERSATVRLIALLGELDARKLYLGEGCSSLFTYCTQVLRLSEHAAYGRIEAARAARTYPMILDWIADGTLTLTAIGLLRQHLTLENHREVLDAARHRSKRQVEELVARLRPQPPVPSSVRKLPAVKPFPAPALLTELCAESLAPHVVTEQTKPMSLAGMPALLSPSPLVLKPLAPRRYKVQFTISAQTHARLRPVQALLRHRVPDGDPAKIFDQSLTLLLEHLQRTKLAAARRPRPQRSTGTRSRHVPAAVKRHVWERDAGRCAFVGTRGRCTETGFLEFHHVEPHAAGGMATTSNIELRCRTHNAYEADLFFGTGVTPTVRERGVVYVT